MKQAKIMLSAIAIIGIIGGAFAFKAHKAQTLPVFKCNAGACVQVATYFVAKVTDPGTLSTYITSATTDPNALCGINGACSTNSFYITAE